MATVDDSVKAAGASGDKAAEMLANCDRAFADIRSDLKLLKWMQGATLVGIVALILRVFLN